MKCMRSGTALLAVCLLALIPTVAAQSGEAYFVIVLGSQRTPSDPNYSHTFATFIHTTWTGNGPCTAPVSLESYTVSWMPRNLKIRPLALLPECGYNFGLHESIQFAQKTDQRVSLWGPYQINPCLFVRALDRVRELQSGRVQYKANDFGYCSGKVSNCIHAVSTVIDGPHLCVFSPGCGEVASYAVLLRMEPTIIDTNRIHPWVGTALGLGQYPIIYREWPPPLSGAVVGPINRLLGGERCLTPTYGRPKR